MSPFQISSEELDEMEEVWLGQTPSLLGQITLGQKWCSFSLHKMLMLSRWLHADRPREHDIQTALVLTGRVQRHTDRETDSELLVQRRHLGPPGNLSAYQPCKCGRSVALVVLL